MENDEVQPRRVFVLGAGAIGASVGALSWPAVFLPTLGD
jgi:hypothetical protein